MIRTLPSKVKQQREFLPIRHLRSLLPELIEEWVAHGLHRTQPRLRRVLEQLRHQIDRLRSRARTEDLQDVMSD